jgi:hypothetical protein
VPPVHPAGEASGPRSDGVQQAGQEAAGTCALVQADSIAPNRVVGIYSVAMEDTPGGLRNKLYWRRTKGEWHCFEKVAVHGLMSLCQRRDIASVHGQ